MGLEAHEEPIPYPLILDDYPITEVGGKAVTVDDITVCEDDLGTIVEVKIVFHDDNGQRIRYHKSDPEGTFYVGNGTNVIRTERGKWAPDLKRLISVLADHSVEEKVLSDLNIE